MFMSNCAHHVSLANPTTWAEMPVPAIDSTDQTDITLNKVDNDLYSRSTSISIMVAGALQLAQGHSALPSFR